MFLHRHRRVHWVILGSVRGTGTYQPTTAYVTDDFGNLREIRYIPVSLRDGAGL